MDHCFINVGVSLLLILFAVVSLRGRRLTDADSLVVLRGGCSSSLFKIRGRFGGRRAASPDLDLVGVGGGLLVAAVVVGVVFVGSAIACKSRSRLINRCNESPSSSLTIVTALVLLLGLRDGVDVGLPVRLVGVEEGVAGGAHGLAEAGAVVAAARGTHTD